MAVVGISIPASIPRIRNLVSYRVRFKKTWADEFKVIKFLKPISANYSIAPSLSSADLLLEYGELKQAGQAIFGFQIPRDEVEQNFVEIQTIDEESTTSIWVGTVENSIFDIFGPTNLGPPSGNQEIKAYGLEHLLDRIPIERAFVKSADGQDPPEFFEIQWFPVFNERFRNGLSDQGNRTEFSIQGIHRFSDEGFKWSHLDIIKYLLAFYGPSNPKFELSGQFEELDKIQTNVDLDGLTIKQALDKLISPQRGLGWVVRTCGDGVVNIHVFTVLTEPISSGDVQIPANPEQFDLQLDDAINISTAKINLNSQSRFEKIIIQGQRLKVCNTFRFADNSLERAWTQAEEDAYEAETDENRKTDKHSRVYTTYRVPKKWDGTVRVSLGIVGGSLVQVPALPCFTDNGTLTFPVDEEGFAAPIFWHYAKAFSRNIPIEKEATIIGAEPEFLAPLVLIQDPTTEKFSQVEKLNIAVGTEKGKQSARIRMLDREMGIECQLPLGHSFGLNHFSGTSKITPEHDYETIRATVFYETDCRVRVIEEIRDGKHPEAERALVIDVPDAEAWYIVPGTLIGVENGEFLKAEGSAAGLVRDDTPRLRQIAAFAKAWYGKQRASFSMTLKETFQFLAPGQIIRQISSSWHRQQVGTVVSEISWDFETGETTTLTDFAELDFVAITSSDHTSQASISSPRVIGRTFKKMDKKIKDLQENIGLFPVRDPNGAVSLDVPTVEVFRWLEWDE